MQDDSFLDKEVWDFENTPTTIPPTTPATIPENKGAPEASAIPRHNGRATRNTTTLAGKSLPSVLNKGVLFLLI